MRHSKCNIRIIGGPNKKGGGRQKIQRLISGGGLLFGTGEYMAKILFKTITATAYYNIVKDAIISKYSRPFCLISEIFHPR